jgi:hypothetical protein
VPHKKYTGIAKVTRISSAHDGGVKVEIKMKTGEEVYPLRVEKDIDARYKDRYHIGEEFVIVMIPLADLVTGR